MQKLNALECIRAGWDIFKKRPFMLIGVFVVAFIVSGISSALLDPGQNAPVTFATTLMSIASGIVGVFVEMGLITFALRAYDSIESAGIKDLWNAMPFFYYFAAQIVVGLSVLLGLVILIVPGIMVALALMFTSYLVIDKHRGPIEALKESSRITKGHRWQLLVLVLTIIGLNILGLIALIVGLLVTIPVSMLAVVHAYRKLEHGASEVAPVSAM